MTQYTSYVLKPQPKKVIVCMSSTHWHFLWQRPQQIMSRLSREYNIIYVDPPYSLPESEIVREKNGKIKNPFRLSSINPSLKVLSAYQVAEQGPEAENNDLQALNIAWLKEQISQSLQILGWFSPPLLWIYNPKAVTMVGKLGEAGVIYDCVDSFASFSWADPRTEQWETELNRKADVIFATASKLYQKWRSGGKTVYLIPNAADYEHFSRAASYGTSVPPEIRRIRRPRLGFVGAIYEWLDLKLLETVARSNPEWGLVMIGPQQHGLEVPKAYPNIHWLGSREYKVLPWYLNSFDVMLIPFLRNQITENANPIKLWEYLATGKPVVTTDLPEIPALAGITWISKNEQEFIENCANALINVTNPLKQKEIANRARLIARKNSWEERCRQIVSILRQVFF